jgi:hypothetical protein
MLFDPPFVEIESSPLIESQISFIIKVGEEVNEVAAEELKCIMS